MTVLMTVSGKQDLVQHRWFSGTSLDLPLILFLVSAFIGLWVSYDRSLSWSMLVTLVVSIVLYWVITRIGLGAFGLQRLAWILLLIQDALALYFITQFKHLGYSVSVDRNSLEK